MCLLHNLKITDLPGALHLTFTFPTNSFLLSFLISRSMSMLYVNNALKWKKEECMHELKKDKFLLQKIIITQIFSNVFILNVNNMATVHHCSLNLSEFLRWNVVIIITHFFYLIFVPCWHLVVFDMWQSTVIQIS